jgi:hypothetical protein
MKYLQIPHPYLWIFLSIFVLLAFPSLAEVNLTVQSDNEQIIKINDVSSHSNINTITTNQTQNLTYDNYIITMYPNIDHLNNGTVFNNLNSFVGDRYKFIWLIIFIVLIFLSYKLLKQF